MRIAVLYIVWSDRSDAPCSKEVDDVAYEVDCANIIIKEGEVDIGGSGFRVCWAKALC